MTLGLTKVHPATPLWDGFALYLSSHETLAGRDDFEGVSVDNSQNLAGVQFEPAFLQKEAPSLELVSVEPSATCIFDGDAAQIFHRPAPLRTVRLS